MAAKEAGKDASQGVKSDLTTDNIDAQIRDTNTAAQALDMIDRDPTSMNDHVRVFFEDVFAEPEGTHSIDGIWRTSYTTFTSTKYWCYRILTAIFGIPTAILCGLYFACLSFDYIWCIMPCLRAYLIELQCLGKIFALCIRTFADPCFESVSRMLGGIKAEVKHV